MALSTGPPGPVISHELRAAGATCSMATIGGMAFPFSLMPPNIMPSVASFAGSGFAVGAFFPAFVPFASSVPVMFYQSHGIGTPRWRPESLVELPSESSASTAGAPMVADRSASGKQTRRLLYRGDSASRSSLESCSGTGRGGGDSASLDELSGGDGSLQDSQTALGTEAWQALHGLSGLEDVQSDGVLTRRAGVDENVSSAAVEPSAPSPPLRRSMAQPRPQKFGPGDAGAPYCGSSLLPSAFAGPTTDSAALPRPSAEGGGCEMYFDERSCLASGPHGRRPEVVSLPRDSEQGGARAGRASDQDAGRVPLPGPSGDLMWVGARRFRAILRRRRQRATQGACLATVLRPCNRKSICRISCGDMAMLRAQASGQLSEAEDACSGHSGERSEDGEDTDDGNAQGDDHHAGDEAMAPMTMFGAAGYCDAHWDARAAAVNAFAASAMAAAAVGAAAAVATGAATAGRLQAEMTRAAMEAELRAVLAEETGVLALSDETATDGGDDEECGNSGGAPRAA